MSSIDSLNSPSTTLSSSEWQLTPEERKRLAQAQAGINVEGKPAETDENGQPTVNAKGPQSGQGAKGAHGTHDAHSSQGLETIALLGLTPKQLMRTQRGEGNKFTSHALVAHLPPPSAPRVQVTQRQATAYQSMAQDVNHALNQVQRTQPQLQTNWNPETNGQGQAPIVGPDGKPTDVLKQAANPVNSFLAGALSGLSSGDLMTAFMALQVQNQSSGLTQRQTLSNLTSQMRQKELENEVKEDQQAEKKTQQALEKAKKMGVLSKVLAALMTILTAVMAVVTLGVGAGLALVAAAMLIGALAGGLKDGKKNGDGFDLEGALNGASMGGDAAMAVMGLGAVMVALEAAMETAVTQMSKEAAKTAAQTGVKGSVAAAKEAGRIAVEQGMKDALLTEAKMTAKQKAKAEAFRTAQMQIRAHSDVLLSDGITKATPKLLRQNIRTVMNRAPAEAQQAFRTALQKAESPVMSRFSEVYNSAFARFRTMNPFKAVSAENPASTSLTGKGLKYVLMGSLGIQAGGQIGQGIVQYQANTLNLDAEEHQQNAAICEKIADTFEQEYEDIQNFMQAVSQSHNKSVNQAMSMLSQHFQTQMRAVQAMVSS